MAAIEVRGLRKRYGPLEAVSDVSFSVERGEVFCLLGPNGAGKSTTTEILEGYRLRDGGEVRVLGLDPGDGVRALRERIGIVLQQCGIQGDLTVAELLELYGSCYRRRRDAGELLELVGLEGSRGLRAGALSGGQRRRLDLALALAGDPDLLFLDEPTTGFDPAARRHAWSTVRRLCELGKTVFLTTHFMDEAQALADRVAVLRAGRIVALGSPDELGGRDRAPACIRFAVAGGAAVLPDLRGCKLRAHGEEVELRTGEPTAVVHRLTGWALAAGVELRGLSLGRPSLEDVYLELTERHEEEAVR